MKNRPRGFTLVELLVVIVVMGILFGLLIPMLARAREESRKKSCKDNLWQIAKAEIAYTQNFNEYLSFAWGPATGAGSPCINQATGTFTAGAAATTACCDAATSLGCLYPQFMDTAKSFKCPSTQDAPSFLPVETQETIARCAEITRLYRTGASGFYLFSDRSWSLVSSNPDKGWGASYGYDCRIYPSGVTNHAIAGDMPATWQGTRRLRAANHADGQNILYLDGSVRWQTTNYASGDSKDNIYCEGGQAAPGGATEYWCADTDSFLVRGSVVLGASWNEYVQIQQ